MTTAFITHPDCLLHDMEHSIPEVPARLRVINEAVLASHLSKLLTSYSAPLATKEQLTRVHDPEYVEYVFLSSPKSGLTPLDPDTWMNPFTLTAALHAAGSVVLAVDLIMTNKVSSVFCNIRPPGHHAEKSTAMGFCFFNNVAVGVAHALEKYNIKKIAIVDFDAHHGNGIENIFRYDDRVLYCSSFEHPFYPFSGADTISDHIINLPLDAGCGGEKLRRIIESHWLKRLAEFKPEILFFSAGFDAFSDDIMSDLLFTADDYAWITREVIKVTNESTKNRIISVLEGGYDLDSLGDCVVAHLNEIVTSKD